MEVKYQLMGVGFFFFFFECDFLNFNTILLFFKKFINYYLFWFYSHFGKVCHFIKYYIQYNLFKFDLKNFYNYN
jgi:hypothetical protein